MNTKSYLPNFDPTLPIPDMLHMRDTKDEYLRWPLDELSDEPVVDLADYGVRGQSFYSQPRPNDVDTNPIPGVRPQVFVRQTVAEMIVAANQLLRTDRRLAEIFGGPVELYIKDALRSRKIQQYVYDVIVPKRLRREHPDWTDEQIMAQRSTVFADPSAENLPPHSTGGAVDVTLVYLGLDEAVDFGYVPARFYSSLAHLDFHEGYRASEEFVPNARGRFRRRALYWTMLQVGFGAHPTEWWHFNYGNQMWAWFLAGVFDTYFTVDDPPPAFYGEVEGDPDLDLSKFTG